MNQKNKTLIRIVVLALVAIMVVVPVVSTVMSVVVTEEQSSGTNHGQELSPEIDGHGSTDTTVGSIVYEATDPEPTEDTEPAE